MAAGENLIASDGKAVRGGGRVRFALPILLSLYALAYLDRQVVTLLVDPIKADLGISDVQYGILQGGAFVLFFTLCSLPIGWAVDRYSRRRIIFWGVLTWSLFTAASGTARSYAQLLFCRFGVGAGEASLAPASYSLLGDLFPPSRLAGAMAIFSTGAIIGGAISLILGGYIVMFAAGVNSVTLPLLGEVRSWQLVFLIIGIPGMLMAFLALLLPEPARAKTTAANSGTMRQLAGHLARFRGFYACHIAGFSLLNIMGAGYVAWIPTVFIREYGWSAGQTGLVLGLLTVVFGTAGMLLSANFVDWLFRRGHHDAHLRYYAVAAVVLGICGIIIGFAPDVWTIVAASAIIKFIIAFIAVAAAALQIPTPPQLRGRTSALFLFVYNIVGFGIGPALVAVIARHLVDGDISKGLGITFLIFAPLTAAIFALGLRPMRRAVREETAQG